MPIELFLEACLNKPKNNFDQKKPMTKMKHSAASNIVKSRGRHFEHLSKTIYTRVKLSNRPYQKEHFPAIILRWNVEHCGI